MDSAVVPGGAGAAPSSREKSGEGPTISDMTDSRTRPRPLHRRRTTRAAAGVLAVALAVGGCSLLSPDDGRKTLESFAEALGNEDAAAAAQLTTDPAAAQAAIEKSLDGLSEGDARPDVQVSAEDGKPSDGPVALDYTWNAPADPSGAPRSVTGNGTARMEKIGEDWKIDWAPTVLDDRFADGESMHLAPALDYSGKILDASGNPAMEWLPVTNVQIPVADAGLEASLPDEVGAIVGERFPEITGPSIRDGAKAASDAAAQDGTPAPEAYTVVTLRDEDLAPLKDRLEGLPGVTLAPDHKLISAGIGGATVDAVAGPLTERLSASGGWSMGIAGSGGVIRQELASAPARPIGDLTSTLDPAVQAAAQSAVDGSGVPSSIVAMRPSTGEILAVAENGAASAFGPVAVQGQFPPGSTFKAVTTSAALTEGVIGPDSTVPCPGVISVDGRTIPNEDEFALGDVPITTAFAKSCNTSQAFLSSGLQDDSLRDTAAKLGIGPDLSIPGIDASTGQVPVAEKGPARVEASIGQGTVTTNPLGLTEMSATIARGGALVLPSFLRGEPATVANQPAPLDPSVVEAIQGYMRAVVTSGTATGANGVPGLHGKTGTAEIGTGLAHGWFTGYTGDLAFTVLMQNADSSTPAVSMAANFASQVPS